MMIRQRNKLSKFKYEQINNQISKYSIDMSEKWKPKEHEGRKENGEPDPRVGTGQFARGKVDPHEAGRKGGEHRAGRDSSMDRNPSNNNLDNSLASRGSGSSNSEGPGFAHGKVDPHDAGRKGAEARKNKNIGDQAAGTFNSGGGNGGQGGSGGTGFAHGKVDPHQAGKKGAETRKAHMVGAH